MTSRKKTAVLALLMGALKYTIEMAPDDMIYIPNFKICFGIRIILRLKSKLSKIWLIWP
jgi:hypothetical protein